MAGAGFQKRSGAGVDCCSGGYDVINEQNFLILDVFEVSFWNLECADYVFSSLRAGQAYLWFGTAGSYQDLRVKVCVVMFGDFARENGRLIETPR